MAYVEASALSSMTGRALRDWRVAQRTIFGDPWTQAYAARWYGVSERTWRRYEYRSVVPLHVSERITELNSWKNSKREKVK